MSNKCGNTMSSLRLELPDTNELALATRQPLDFWRSSCDSFDRFRSTIVHYEKYAIELDHVHSDGAGLSRTLRGCSGLATAEAFDRI